MFGQRAQNNTDTSATDPLAAPVISPAPTTINPPSVPSMPSAPLPPTPPMPQMPEPIMTTAGAAPFAPEPTSPTAGVPADTEELIRMKQEALKHLQPLVTSLQQPPEEEFRTLMMMIQATDDKTLLKKAFDAAKKIKDDKVRAQAMLDVVNEINYFTQSNTAE